MFLVVIQLRLYLCGDSPVLEQAFSLLQEEHTALRSSAYRLWLKVIIAISPSVSSGLSQIIRE